MPRANKRKFYAVRVGRTPGIYYDWESAQKQVHCEICAPLQPSSQ